MTAASAGARPPPGLQTPDQELVAARRTGSHDRPLHEVEHSGSRRHRDHEPITTAAHRSTRGTRPLPMVVHPSLINSKLSLCDSSLPWGLLRGPDGLDTPARDRPNRSIAA